MKKDIIEISKMKDLKEKSSLELQEEAIQLKRAGNLSMVELGKRLYVLKEQCLKHSEYMRFVEEKLKLKYSISNRYVRLVKSYGIVESNSNVELVESLGVKKAMRLLVISDLAERLAYIKDNNLVEKTYKEIDEMLNEKYPPKIKTINSYSMYKNIHSSLETNLQHIKDHKNLGNTELNKEVSEIEKELRKVVNKINALNIKLEKIKKDKQKAMEQQVEEAN